MLRVEGVDGVGFLHELLGGAAAHAADALGVVG